MDYKYIVYEKEGQIARITLNKPDKLNVICFLGPGEDFSEVLSAYEDAAKDDNIKVVILKGSGRAFTAGHDITKVGFIYGMGTRSEDKRPSQRIRLWKDRAKDEFLRILLHPKITISQVHGYCIGGGVYLVLCTDLAVCTEDATLGFTEQRLGFSGSGIPVIPLLFSTVGVRRGLDLLLTGRTFDGKEAEKMGLVNKAVPVDKLDEETEKLAKAMCLLPRDGIAAGKATRHLIYDLLNLSTFGNTICYPSHTLFTNLRWEPDEYNFFKERRDRGAKAGFHDRDKRFAGLV